VTNENQSKVGPRKDSANRRRAKGQPHGERGAILILAMAYITVIGVIVAALTTWTSGDLNNTSKFTAARSLDYSLSSAVEVAIDNIRYAPVAASVNAAVPVACWGSSPSTYTLPNAGAYDIATWCSTLSVPGTYKTRTVTISACVSTTSAAACAASPQLQVVIVFDDYSKTGQPANGYGATLESWDWSSKAGNGSSLPNSISLTSTPPAIPLVGNTYDTAASATSGDTVAVTSSNSLICSVSGSVVSFVANGPCTIYFSDPGNVNYQAATQVSQYMVVGPLANTITVSSAQPTNATVGGSTYTPVASATSGDTVAVTVASASTSYCSVSSGVVTFIGAGTCTLDFNDPGNTDYVAASQVTQSFTVSVGTPAGVSILGYSSSPNGEPNNGDSVTYTYNQTMNGASLLSGFSGSSTAVDVQLSRTNGSSTVWKVCSTAACTTLVNLGTVSLGDGGTPTPGYYVATAGNTVVYSATMSMSTVNGESVVTVVLGATVSGTVSALNPTTTQTTLVWTPSASATGSTYGTACSTTAVTEANAPQRNF
jgi:hypothetical protein